MAATSPAMPWGGACARAAGAWWHLVPGHGAVVCSKTIHEGSWSCDAHVMALWRGDFLQATYIYESSTKVRV